jgi:hypothetical protein
MQAKEYDYYTPEEYLEFEINSPERHEYIDGEIIPMTGGLPNHNLITALCARITDNKKKGKINI